MTKEEILVSIILSALFIFVFIMILSCTSGCYENMIINQW